MRHAGHLHTGTGGKAMNELRPVVLVTRASTDIGVRVAHALRRHGGFELRLLVAVSEATRARAIAEPAGEVVHGDPDDFETLRHAMAGCWGVVGVSHDRADAVMTLIDAAADAGARRVMLVRSDDADSRPRLDPAIVAYARSAGVDVVELQAGLDGAGPHGMLSGPLLETIASRAEQQ